MPLFPVTSQVVTSWAFTSRVLAAPRSLPDLPVAKTLAKLATTVLLASSLAGCLGYDGEINHGFQADAQTIADVKQGASAEQVLVVLGTPSTTSTVGGDAWYYISQKTDRTLAFMPPRMVDQRVFAVYFDKAKKVTRVANYGLEDGKVVNFSNRSTQTSGAEASFLSNMMLSLMHFGAG